MSRTELRLSASSWHRRWSESGGDRDTPAHCLGGLQCVSVSLNNSPTGEHTSTLTIAVYDKIISLYQGRPVSFDEDRMHVPHRFLDRYEEQELWTPFAYASHLHYPGRPARAICTFTALCSLSVIMVRTAYISLLILTSGQGRIITQIYADKALPDRPADLLRRLSASLDKWKEALPPDIAINPNLQDGAAPPPHVMSLQWVFFLWGCLG